MTKADKILFPARMALGVVAFLFLTMLDWISWVLVFMGVLLLGAAVSPALTPYGMELWQRPIVAALGAAMAIGSYTFNKWWKTKIP